MTKLKRQLMTSFMRNLRNEPETRGDISKISLSVSCHLRQLLADHGIYGVITLYKDTEEKIR